MADDIVYITFENDQLGANVQGSTPQNSAAINGTLEIDYTTGQVQGTYKISGDVTSTQQIQEGGDLTKNGNDYTFDDGRLRFSYTGEQPTQANLISYQTDPNQPDSVQYSTTDEPTPQLSSSTTAPVVCFASGTAIMTAEGPVNVEHLAIGDMVLTTAGTYSRIGWIGHRVVDVRKHRRSDEVRPIRISAHAFATNAPCRDLLVSPGHSICVDVGGEVLIPAGALVNGTSVVQEEVETITYWHVELEQHDVLLAENLPCESYLAMSNRGFFVESGVVDFGALPDASVVTHADFCRPFHASGAVVEAVRCRLKARAAASGETAAAREAA